MASYWPIIPGALIVLFTLRETFQDLFHPSQSGTLSDFIARRTFAVFRRFPRLLPNAGPLSVVIVIFVWVLLICFGFALIYWPLPHADFKVEGSRSAGDFWGMVYFSLEMITTLGIGDYSPRPTYLRMTAMAEAVIGFGILTASVSSIILIHSALGRQEAFARRISLIYRAGEQSSPEFIHEFTEQTLQTLLSELIRVRVDLNHLPIVYYFHSPGDEASLPRLALPVEVGRRRDRRKRRRPSEEGRS